MVTAESIGSPSKPKGHMRVNWIDGDDRQMLKMALPPARLVASSTIAHSKAGIWRGLVRRTPIHIKNFVAFEREVSRHDESERRKERIEPGHRLLVVTAQFVRQSRYDG